MSRHFDDWLTAYVKYASVTEAPRRMHFWSGVSAIAGALRRKVWIDQRRFVWYPNFYIIFVADPGIVSKSVTMDVAKDLLKNVPGIKFGPDIVTWPALVGRFAEASEAFEYNGEFYPMCALTLYSRELGNLLDPQDRSMMTLYIDLWDGPTSLEKVTKVSGCDSVDSPWINLMGCTTPDWIADNMPTQAIGGGFTSRCVFVYADAKEQYIPFVDEVVGADDAEVRLKLIQDLEHIAISIVGPYTITPEARDWYRPLYVSQWKDAADRMDTAMVKGYVARKQTHLFKLAMVVAAAQRDARYITAEDAQLANIMLEALEPDMPKVFAKIGKSEGSIQIDRLLSLIKRSGEIPYEDAMKVVHAQFPGAKGFEDIIAGAIRAGYIIHLPGGRFGVLKYLGGFDEA